MNEENLQTLIDRYEENYSLINNEANNEIFKWKAVRCFRDAWFSENAGEMSFSGLLKAATKECSCLINNSMTSPANGIVKMAEVRPREVGQLFREVLFSPYASIPELQEHMDRFLSGMEEIRQAEFPRCFKYKQDRHAASCYLSFFDPERHFIYRYSDAEEFAQYIEFGKDLGQGDSFSLENYYEMAALAAEALKKRGTLLDRHRALIGDDPGYYRGAGMHLMAFDLMYCSRTYDFYSGLRHARKADSLRAYSARQLHEQELAEYREKAAALQDELHAIALAMEPIEEISLLDVEVTLPACGVGKVISQEANRITVQFPGAARSFLISSRYALRPTFEDDAQVVEAFTRYEELLHRRERLQKELDGLQTKLKG